MVKATLQGMNDFEDYETTLELDVLKGISTLVLALEGDGDFQYGDMIPFTVTVTGNEVAESIAVTGSGTIHNYDPQTGTGTIECGWTGPITVSVTTEESANWLSSSDSVSFEIAKRSVEATWLSTEDRVYDGAASIVTAAFTDSVALRDGQMGRVDFEVTGGDAVVGGTHTATVAITGEFADAYEIVNPTVEYTITQTASSSMTARVLDAGGASEIEDATYGDTVTFEVTISPGSAATVAASAGARQGSDIPDTSSVTFAVGGTELETRDAVAEVGPDGTYTMRFAFDTSTRLPPIGDNTIDVAFSGDGSMPAASATCSLALERAPLSLALAAVDGKPYDATTDVTGIEFELAGTVGDDVPEVSWDEAAWVAADPGTDAVRVAGIALDGDSDAWYDLDDNIEASGVEGQPANGATIRTADVTVTVELEGKVYDGEPVGEPEVAVVGEAGTQSTGDVAITWFASDGQGGWVEIEGAPVDAGDYRVEATAEADGNHNASAEPGFALFTIERAPQDTPEGVTSTDETEPGASDGTISGLPAGSEWCPEGGTWADAPEGGVVSGFAPGAYEVRMKGDANHEPSEPVTIRVGAASALAGIIGTGDPAAIAGTLAAAGAIALAVGATRRRR